MAGIDFIKGRFPAEHVKALLDVPELDFRVEVSEKNADVREYPKTAHYHGLKFIIEQPHAARMQGSLHQFWNALHGWYEPGSAEPYKGRPHERKGHNHDDFPAWALWEVINHLEGVIGIPADALNLENLEVGVNLRAPGFDTRTALDSMLLYKTGTWGEMPGSIGKKYFGTQFEIKFYDKQMQYRLPFPVLRHEFKAKKMEALKAAKVFTLADLRDPDRLRALGAILIASLDNLLIYEGEVAAMLKKPSERELWENARHPTKWLDLLKKVRKNNGKTAYKWTRKFNRRRVRYRAICNRYPEACILPRLRSAVEAKVRELIGGDPEKRYKLTGISVNQDPKKRYKLTGISEPAENAETVQNDTLNIQSICTHETPAEEARPDRVCAICEQPLVNMRSDAKFCCKRCRNAASNPRNNRRQKYGDDWGLLLF